MFSHVHSLVCMGGRLRGHIPNPGLQESGRAGIMIGAHRIRADKTGLVGFGAKNGTHGIESSKTVYNYQQTGSERAPAASRVVGG